MTYLKLTVQTSTKKSIKSFQKLKLTNGFNFLLKLTKIVANNEFVVLALDKKKEEIVVFKHSMAIKEYEHIARLILNKSM